MRVKHFRAVRNQRLRWLLPTLRTPEAAAQELRWIEKEVADPIRINKICRLRGRAYPLQYLLGSQPFGRLDILCARKVLIPRWETEEWTLKLANRLENGLYLGRGGQGKPPYRSADWCTGTGCVALALEAETGVPGTGIDISDHAARCFRKNTRQHNLKSNFVHGDLFKPLDIKADLITANPPYIPAHELAKAERSVRIFEPRLALLGDTAVYDALITRTVDAGARAAVFEVGDASQIEFCTKEFDRHGWASRGELDGAGRPRTVWAWKDDWASVMK